MYSPARLHPPVLLEEIEMLTSLVEAAGLPDAFLGDFRGVLDRLRTLARAPGTGEIRMADAVASMLPGVIYVIDVQSSRYRYVNAAIETLIGLKREEVIGKDQQVMISRMHPDDVPRVLEKHYRQLETLPRLTIEEQDRYIHVDEYRIRDGQGRWRWFRSSARIFERSADGAILSILGIALDISETKDLEGRLRLSDRMASAGRLAAGVAHEINNPLSHLIAGLELLGEEIERPPELGHVRSRVQKLHDSASRIGQIVRDLRTFSRADDETLGPVEVESSVEKIVPLVANEIRHRARLEFALGHPPHVRANEGRLGQLLLNLLINAAQSIPEGAAERNQIRISTGSAQGNRAFIEVADTGSGISPEHLSRIFDPFFTTKPVGTGTGLGLAICESIVRSFGGEIQVTSELGRGSAFRVLLPLAEIGEAHPPRPASEAREEPPAPRRASLLVVDDNQAVAQIVGEALSEHDVRIVSRGEDALREILAPGATYDLILCDVMMPSMTGIELHERLRALGRGDERRIVFLTGGALSSSARAFIGNTRNLVILKPFRVREIRAAVRARLEELDGR